MRKHFENRARCRLNRSSRDVLSTDAEPATARLCEPSGRAARVSTTRWREIWLHVCVCVFGQRPHIYGVCVYMCGLRSARCGVSTTALATAGELFGGGLHARVLRSDRRNKFVTTE